MTKSSGTVTAVSQRSFSAGTSPLEWVAVYYDNPDEVPAEKLRCDTAVTVPDDFVIPENN
jgi:DNA gyrase inhibitor GyrI